MEICSILLKNCNLYQKPVLFTAKLSVVLVIILNNNQQSVCSPDLEFVSQPRDVSAKEDTSASFHCTLRSRIPFSSANSYWENGLTETLPRNELYNVTTIPDTINQSIRSYLTINEVERDMNPLYKCRITITFLDDSPKIISSDFARLNVLYFLNDDELHCRGPSSSVLREGDHIAIECEGVQTNPSSVLRWLQSSPASSPLSQASSFSQTGSLLRGNIIATHLLHKNLLVCVAESEVFPEERVNCSLGPFKVIHSPVVKVIPAHAEMIWPLVSEMTFQCIASGYPDIDQYEWFCHPQEKFGHCSSNVPNLTIVIQDVRTARILNITCQARNDVAKTQRTSTISVEYIPESMIPTCSSSTPRLPQMSYNGKPSVQYNVATGVAQCSAEVQSIELTIFRWYLKGLLIEKNDGEHVVVKSSDGGSHLVVYDSITLTRRQGIIACSIRFNKYDELRIEQVAACKMSNAFEDYTITDRTESWQAMDYSAISSTKRHISVKTIKELENVSVVSSSIQQHQDSETISKRNLTTPKFHSYETIITSKSKGLVSGFQIYAIPALTASGILSFLIIIIVVMRKSEYCKFAGTYPCVRPTAEEMQFDVRRSTTSDVEEDRCYEIPDPEIRPSNPTRCREINTYFSPSSRRHIDIDSLIDGESASESSTESTGSLLYSSPDSAGYSKNEYLQDEEINAPCLHHYENQNIVESLIGNAGSKYFRARIAKEGGKGIFGCERRIHSDHANIKSSSSTKSSSL